MTKSLEIKAIKLALEAAMTDNSRFTRLREIESGIAGSMRNPSDSDMDTPRIGHGDVMDQKPELYREWCLLNNASSAYQLARKQLRNPEAIALFTTTYSKNY